MNTIDEHNRWRLIGDVCRTVQARTDQASIEKTGIQRILRLYSPVGVCVEIWSGAEAES